MTSTATIFATASLLLPYIALAQVRITEVMYDASGADEGREWIEVINTGSVPKNVSKYSFFENGTNHGLKLVSGSALLQPGGSAIIASDAAKFTLDYPQFSGTLFDSAFQLSNKGEALSLKDASSTVLETISYTATSLANGTGGSLHKDGSNFVPAMPTPGVYPGTLTPVPEPIKNAPIQKTSTKNIKTLPQGKPASSVEQSFSSPKTYTAALAAPALSLPQGLLWGLVLAGVILLGIAGVLFARLSLVQKETKTPGEEFTIE